MKANAILRHRNKRATDHSMPGEKKTFIFSERTAKLVEQILDSKKMITPLSQVPKSPLKLSSDFAFDNMTKNDAELIARSLSHGTPKTE